MRQSASNVVSALPAPAHAPAHQFIVHVDDEDVLIPQRIYNPEVSDDVTASWPTLERDVYACLYTRHYDGYVRQRHLRSIVGRSHPWVVPFVVQLMGEYVVEIVAEIREGLSDLNVPGSSQHAKYAAFVAANTRFLDLTSSRVVSYWNCYYRVQYPELSEYPGFQLISSLKHAAAQSG
jgi:hypothetical protein